eukprot:1151742-Pelagomonas_calceolata.AAC.5
MGKWGPLRSCTSSSVCNPTNKKLPCAFAACGKWSVSVLSGSALLLPAFPSMQKHGGQIWRPRANHSWAFALLLPACAGMQETCGDRKNLSPRLNSMHSGDFLNISVNISEVLHPIWNLSRVSRVDAHVVKICAPSNIITTAPNGSQCL